MCVDIRTGEESTSDAVIGQLSFQVSTVVSGLAPPQRNMQPRMSCRQTAADLRSDSGLVMWETKLTGALSHYETLVLKMVQCLKQSIQSKWRYLLLDLYVWFKPESMIKLNSDGTLIQTC